jgi:hypothetical protein
VENGLDIEKIYIQSPGAICICVDEYDEHGILGRIYHPGSEKPLHFDEIGRLLIQTDRILDEQHYPQPSTSGRSFTKRTQNQSKAKEKTPMLKKTEITQKGGKGTFVVQVQYRQHATWQGKVLWAEKNESMQFRSALELLKLIDSALDSEEQKPADQESS